MKDYKPTGEELNIVKVGKTGLSVQLSDGSKWKIKTGDISKTLAWYPTQRITVENNDSDVYPFLLTNLDTAGPDQAEAQ